MIGLGASALASEPLVSNPTAAAPPTALEGITFTFGVKLGATTTIRFKPGATLITRVKPTEDLLMPRFFPGSEFTLQAFVRDENGTLVDADAVVFLWRMRHWDQNRRDVAGSVVHTGTGIYESTVIPAEGGNLHFRWEVTTPDIVQESQVSVADTQFPTQV